MVVYHDIVISLNNLALLTAYVRCVHTCHVLLATRSSIMHSLYFFTFHKKQEFNTIVVVNSTVVWYKQ